MFNLMVGAALALVMVGCEKKPATPASIYETLPPEQKPKFRAAQEQLVEEIKTGNYGNLQIVSGQGGSVDLVVPADVWVQMDYEMKLRLTEAIFVVCKANVYIKDKNTGRELGKHSASGLTIN